MTACPTCGRRPSERRRTLWGTSNPLGDPIAEFCCDPIHDLADQGPALMAERDETRKRLQATREGLVTERENTARCVATIARIEHERDEARELVMELFQRGCQVEPFSLDSPLRYDHMCSATYQEAQAALIAWGLVKREECVRP